MGAFPISIATSLALESFSEGTQPAYDPARIIPQKVNLQNYESFYCSLLTLYRNIEGAVDKTLWKHVSPGDIVDTLEFEAELITRLVQDLTFGKTKVVFYTSNYNGLAFKYPHAKLRVDSTPKQKEYTALMQLVIGEYFKSQAKSASLQHYSLAITPKQKTKALILTHYAYDLLSQSAFTALDLIESHTGVLKKPSQFYTKLTGGKDLFRVPFQRWSLQVFGDSTLFFAFPLKVRQQVLELADRYKWDTTTTKDRLAMSFDSMADKFTATMLKDML